MRSLPRSLYVLLALATCHIAPQSMNPLLSSLHAQGRTSYLNFESIQVKPICVARVGGHDFVLACNTPDNSLEIYDAETNAFVDRIAVGIEPVSVRWNPILSRAYTANMVGDSVSSISLGLDSAGALVAKIDRSEWVGDEPMDIAFAADGLSIFVTLHSQAAIAWLNALTLKPVAPGGNKIRLYDTFFATPTQAIKEPRQMLVSGNRLYILGGKGSRFGVSSQINLWSADLTTFAVTKIGGLGTSPLGLAATSSGELFVSAGEAQNQLLGEANVKAATYGFVESWLQRITNPSSATPIITRRNINQIFPSSGPMPVAKNQALANPSDIVIRENAQGGIDKVYVAAFMSDRVGVIHATLAALEATSLGTRFPNAGYLSSR